MGIDKERYILPPAYRHYWSIGSLGSKFRLPVVGDWSDPKDHSVHYFIVTYDEGNSQDLALWEGIHVDGELRYEVIAVKKLVNDHDLRQKAQDFALWIFVSRQPEKLSGVKFF